MATRSDRTELIDKDNGDPDAEVFINRSNNLGTRTRYHVDRECREIHGDRGGRTVTREFCHRRDYPPCKYCVDLDRDADESNRGRSLTKPCPLCGEEDVMLSSHLPKCDGHE